MKIEGKNKNINKGEVGDINSKQGKISRRSFLKGIGALGVSSLIMGKSPLDVLAQQSSEKLPVIGKNVEIKSNDSEKITEEYNAREQKIKNFLVSHIEFGEENRKDTSFIEAFEDLRSFVYQNRDNKQILESYANFLAHKQERTDMSVFNSGHFIHRDEDEPNLNDPTAKEFMLNLLTREEEPAIEMDKFLQIERTAKDFLRTKKENLKLEESRRNLLMNFDLSEFLKIVSGKDTELSDILLR